MNNKSHHVEERSNHLVRSKSSLGLSVLVLLGATLALARQPAVHRPHEPVGTHSGGSIHSLALVDCWIDEDECASGGAGHANGEVDPGETARLHAAFVHVGDEELEDVIVVVQPETEGVVLLEGPTFLIPSVGTPGTFVVSSDFVVDASVECGTELEFTFFIEAAGFQYEFTCTVPIPEDCEPCEPPGGDFVLFTLGSCEAASDWCEHGGPGSGDGELDPGEEAILDAWFGYASGPPLTDVVVDAWTTTPGVGLTVASASVGPLTPGQVFNVALPFETSVTVLECGTDIVFEFIVVADGTTYGPYECTVPVAEDCEHCPPLTGAETFGLDGCLAVDDACPGGGEFDGDGFVDPGEVGVLEASILFAGPWPIDDVLVLAASDTPGFGLVSDIFEAGTIINNETFVATFPFETSPTVLECGVDIAIELLIIAGDMTYGPLTCTLPVQPTCVPCDLDTGCGVLVIGVPGNGGLTLGWDETMNATSCRLNLVVGTLQSLAGGLGYDHVTAACGGPGSVELPMPAFDAYFIGDTGEGAWPRGLSSLGTPRPEGDPGCP